MRRDGEERFCHLTHAWLVKIFEVLACQHQRGFFLAHTFEGISDVLDGDRVGQPDMIAADLLIQIGFGLGTAAGHGVFARGRFRRRGLRAGCGLFSRFGLGLSRGQNAGRFGCGLRRAGRHGALLGHRNCAGRGWLFRPCGGRRRRFRARGGSQGLCGAAGRGLRLVLVILPISKPGRGRAGSGAVDSFLPQGVLLFLARQLPHLHLLAQGGAFLGRKAGTAGGDDAVLTLRLGGQRNRPLLRRGGLGRPGCGRCRGRVLHGRDGLLDLRAGSASLRHAAGRFQHFFGNMRNDQRFGPFLAFAAVIPVLWIWQDAVPPSS